MTNHWLTAEIGAAGPQSSSSSSPASRAEPLHAATRARTPRALARIGTYRMSPRTLSARTVPASPSATWFNARYATPHEIRPRTRPARTPEGIWEGDRGNDARPPTYPKPIASPSRASIANACCSSRTAGLKSRTEALRPALLDRAWRIGSPDAFHEEVGYWLYEPATGLIMRCFMPPRGMTVLAGGTAPATARKFSLEARAGDEAFGICSSPFLNREFKTVRYTIEVEIVDDDTLRYSPHVHAHEDERPVRPRRCQYATACWMTTVDSDCLASGDRPGNYRPLEYGPTMTQGGPKVVAGAEGGTSVPQPPRRRDPQKEARVSFRHRGKSFAPRRFQRDRSKALKPSGHKGKNGGNPWPPEDVAAAVGLAHGAPAFYYLAASARDYGLTDGARDSKKIGLTPLGKSLVYPLNEGEEAAARLEAFEKVKPFADVLGHYGDRLPELQYVKNTLKREFGLDERYHEEFVDLFKSNCEFIGVKEGRP